MDALWTRRVEQSTDVALLINPIAAFKVVSLQPPSLDKSIAMMNDMIGGDNVSPCTVCPTDRGRTQSGRTRWQSNTCGMRAAVDGPRKGRIAKMRDKSVRHDTVPLFHCSTVPLSAH